MTIRIRDLMVTSTAPASAAASANASVGRILVDVPDLELERGRPLTIVGESGSGKSLLAHAIMGTLASNLGITGRLTLDGQVLDLAERRNRRRLWGRVMALLPQEPALALDPTMRVGAQVAEGAAAFQADRRAAQGLARDLLAGLGLAHSERAYPHTLSGGMAQRVAFAAATIADASLLIADEPSKGLDPRARGDLAALLRRHVERGGLLLTITHDLDLARELGGEVLVMREASAVERGPADQVLATPTHPYTRRLLAAEPSRWDHPWMRRGVEPRDRAPVLLSAKGLAKSFAHNRLFADLSVVVRAGERVGLSGPSGSGKTTLGNLLLRLLPPDAGRVEHADALAGGRLQKLYQDPALAFPAHVSTGQALGDVVRRHRVDPARVEELLATLRLSAGLLSRRPGQVSGGELQRLAIVRCMLLEPALIFADEPTSRLDLVTQEETMACLMTQVDRQGAAVLLVTHDEALADAVTDRVVSLLPGGVLALERSGAPSPGR